MKKCASFLILLSTVSFSQLLNFNFGSPYWVDMNLINEIKIGEKYSSLVNKVQPTGFRSVRWDATNKFGEQVSSGIYLYTIQAGEFRQTKKMVLLK